MPTRRTILAGGLSAVAAGLVAGTGAFESDRADHGMTVEFSGDTEAVLGMTAGEEDRSYVTVNRRDGGVAVIRVSEVNANAKTRITDLITFTNNSEQVIRDITFDVIDESRGAEISVDGDMTDVFLEPGRSVTGLGIVVDTREFDARPEIEGTIEISAVTAA